MPEGQYELHKTTAFRFDLTEAQGTNQEVPIGTNEIAVIEEIRELENLISLFPGILDKAKLVFNKPYSAVDVPIRMASRFLHCKDTLKLGEVQLNKSLFYPGCVLTGRITVPQSMNVTSRGKDGSKAHQGGEAGSTEISC